MKLWLLGLAGLGAWLFATKTSTGKALMTPARAAIHGHLMGYEMDPHKLEKAAHLFEREGLHAHADQLADKAKTIGAQMQAAAELAERARAGDQNAMAMIVMCREEALKGSKRALVTCICIKQYCEANPVHGEGEATISPHDAESPQGAAEVS